MVQQDSAITQYYKFWLEVPNQYTNIDIPLSGKDKGLLIDVYYKPEKTIEGVTPNIHYTVKNPTLESLVVLDIYDTAGNLLFSPEIVNTNKEFNDKVFGAIFDIELHNMNIGMIRVAGSKHESDDSMPEIFVIITRW